MQVGEPKDDGAGFPQARNTDGVGVRQALPIGVDARVPGQALHRDVRLYGDGLPVEERQRRATAPTIGALMGRGARAFRIHVDIGPERAVQPVDAGEVGLAGLDRRHGAVGVQVAKAGDAGVDDRIGEAHRMYSGVFGPGRHGRNRHRAHGLLLIQGDRP